MARSFINIIIALGLCIFLISCETIPEAPSNTYKHGHYDDLWS